MKLIDSVVKDSRFRFSFLMWLIAFHSLSVGLALMFLPSDYFHRFFQFQPVGERFFSVQAGVFHLVLAFGYSLCGWRPDRYEGLLILSVTAKFMATAFLLIYSFSVAWIPVLFLSGLGDGLMGAVMLWAYRSFRHKGGIVNNGQ